MKAPPPAQFRPTVLPLARPTAHAEQPGRELKVVLAFAVVSGLLLAAALWYLRQDAIRAGERLTAALAHVIAEQTTRSVQALEQRLQFAAHELQDLRAEGPLDPEDGRAFLREQLSGLPFVRTIFVLDAEGRVVLDSGGANAGLMLADRDYFQVHRDAPGTRFFLGKLLRSRTAEGHWLMGASVPLRDAQGRFEGVIVAGVEPPYFQSLWRELDLGERGTVAMFHRDGQMLMRTPADSRTIGRSYQSLGLFRHRLPAAPEGLFAGPSAIDEVPRIAAYRALARYPQLVVLVGTSMDHVLAPWRRFAWLTSGVWLLAVAGAAVLGRQLHRQSGRRRHLEQRFRELAQAMPQIVFITDNAGVVQYVNERWCEATGLPVDAAVGARWDELAHPDDAQAVADSLDAAIAAGQAVQLEVRLRNLDGSWRWQLVRAVPNRDAQGKVGSWFGTSTDVHELKLAHERLRQQADEIRQLNATLEDRIARRTRELAEREAALRMANEQLRSFSYSVSHDLQSPLQRIGSFAQLLQREPALNAPGSKSAHYLQRIVANVGEMVQMVQGLLVLSRVTQAEIVRRHVDLSAMATQVLEQLQADSPQRCVRWQVEPDLVVLGDTGLMRSVLENLLGNAWKFTSRTAEAEIVVGRAPDGAIFVRDNGAGFDMAHAQRLFGTFERLHRQDEFPGTGIGLATVERAIRRQGGRVWAEGQPGRGAAFYFTMPQPQ